jgi:hypothetical protein
VKELAIFFEKKDLFSCLFIKNEAYNVDFQKQEKCQLIGICLSKSKINTVYEI